MVSGFLDAHRRMRRTDHVRSDDLYGLAPGKTGVHSVRCVEADAQRICPLRHADETIPPPRETGIKDLETFIGGAEDYLRSSGIEGIRLEGFSGDEPYEAAEQLLKNQIDAGMPVPMLMLNHRNKEFGFCEWHWFLLVGYEDRQVAGAKVCYAKAATYGKAHWLRFDHFWDTGEEERGGLIIVRENPAV